jgi:hypothetical protein
MHVRLRYGQEISPQSTLLFHEIAFLLSAPRQAGKAPPLAVGTTQVPHVLYTWLERYLQVTQYLLYLTQMPDSWYDAGGAEGHSPLSSTVYS